MKQEYSLRISLSAHKHDHPEKPYYWCILCYETEWYQVAYGWEETPELCFLKAHEIYAKQLHHLI